MTNAEKEFLERYYKACNTSQPKDWLSACLAAKSMYNEGRNKADDAVEADIRIEAGQKYHGVAKIFTNT